MDVESLNHKREEEGIVIGPTYKNSESSVVLENMNISGYIRGTDISGNKIEVNEKIQRIIFRI